jgi:ribosomal protein S5
MLGLAGISDIWLKTYGTTGTRGNLVYAVFAALKNLNRTKGDI